jgi:hypothetical protein
MSRNSILSAFRLTAVITSILAIAAGCNRSDSGAAAGPSGGGSGSGMMRGGGPGGPGGPGTMMGGGPGGPGGMMGGRPGGMGRGRMGGGPGGPGGPIAENASGTEIFQAKCQFCHGTNGQGGRAPKLANVAGSDNDLTKIVHDGKGKMPAFGSQLSDAQIKKVVAAIKQFGSAK